MTVEGSDDGFSFLLKKCKQDNTQREIGRLKERKITERPLCLRRVRKREKEVEWQRERQWRSKQKITSFFF